MSRIAREIKPPEVLSTILGDSEMGRRMRAHDWSKTSIGPIETWPQSLKTSINIILNSRHPMWIGWGSEKTFLYNDAYIDVLSKAKHPWALGRPAAEVWAEIWDICGPLADKVFTNGEATFVDNVRLFMNRGDFVEETFYSFSYSPIQEESGRIGGLFCPSAETTPKVLNERRLWTLSELSAHSLVERSVEAACASAMATLAKNTDDVPFALLYLANGHDKRTARLVQCTGLPADSDLVAPKSVLLNDSGRERESCLWPISEVLRSAKSKVVSVEHVDLIPTGLANQKVSNALVLPLSSQGEEQPVAALIAGISPARRLDRDYRTFFELVANQVAAAIQSAKAAEEEIRRAEALAEIDRAKTVFFSNVSHEFRTPLTLMLGPIEDMLSDRSGKLPPGLRTEAEVVHRNALRLQKLVNSLLDFARIEAGRAQGSFVPTDLAALTSELAGSFQSAIEGAGLRFVVECPPLPEAIYIDPSMWEKIVLNLLSNAFKFTFKGEIKVSLQWCRDSVELRVQDTGIGIPPDELPRIFERFHRVDGARGRSHEGTGIGLALVQELTKLQGGTVTAESQLGRGTLFRVRIPSGTAHLSKDRIGAGQRTLSPTGISSSAYLSEAAQWRDIEPTREVAPAAHATGTPSRSTNHARILIADDNADMRNYLKRLLSEYGEVQVVSNGKQAVEAARLSLPDLIVSDVMMPELDGIGLIRELRRNAGTRRVPVILISARVGEESIVEGLRSGANDYLVKPFSANELHARVGAQLALSQSRRESMQARRVLQSQGEMAQLVRAMDWSRTPLGPLDSWPLSLKTHVEHCLDSRFPSVIWWGAELVQIYNDGYRVILGGKHPKALGQRARECWSEIWDVIHPLIQSVMDTGRAVWVEDSAFFLERSGYLEEAYFTFSYTPLRDETGSVAGIFETVAEVTHQILARRRLALLRELGDQSVARTIPDVCTAAMSNLARHPKDLPFVSIYLLDPPGKNATLAASTGFRPGQSRFPDSIDLERGDPFRFGDAWKSGAHVLFQGKDLPFGELPGGAWPEPANSFVVLPIPQPEGRPFGFLIAGISPRRALDDTYLDLLHMIAQQLSRSFAAALTYEQELKRAEQLAELDRLKTEFFSNISHEFRTPLTLILGPVEDALAAAGNQLSGEKLDLVRRNALRLYKLVNTLLDFSRIEAGRTQASFVPTDLSSFTADLASAFHSAAVSAGLTLIVDCPALPESVYVDPEMWEKIVLNLLSNAIKYTYAGEIRVELGLEGSHAVLKVQDTGTGIPENELPHIFERFYRVRSTQGRSHEGTGIGLALVQELVKLHGGTIEVQSKLGSGTVFTVRIPRGAAHLPSDRLNASLRPRSSAAGAASFVEEAMRWSDSSVGPPGLFDGKSSALSPSATLPEVSPEIADAHILLADDNADLRRYVAGILRLAFHSVDTVTNGREALEAVKRRRPDLILSDVMMPELDGFGLVRALRSDPRTRTIPIILLSARAGEESSLEGLQRGADDYLVKPFSARELIARVKTRIEMDRIRRESARHEREKELLREAVEVRDEFLSVASHELKTPVTSLKLQLQLTQRKIKRGSDPAPSPDKLASAIETSLRQTNRLTELVEDLLDVSRIRLGKLEFKFEELDAGVLIRDVLERYSDPLMIAKCEAVVQAPEHLMARWDRSRIEQVMVNLLSNAIKYAPGHPIHINLREKEGRAILSIRDFGPGIPKERSEKIFERFERATSSRNISGLGLGLFITRRIVEGHQGQIRLESEPERGAVFIVELPLRPFEKNGCYQAQSENYGT